MISKIQNLGSHLLSTDVKAKMIDDDLYYILLEEVQLVSRFEALPEILENTQIFLAEILENTQIFNNIVVVLPTFWWHIADYLPRKSGSGVVAYVHLLMRVCHKFMSHPLFNLFIIFSSSDYTELSEEHSCCTDYARNLNGKRPMRSRRLKPHVIRSRRFRR